MISRSRSSAGLAPWLMALAVAGIFAVGATPSVAAVSKKEVKCQRAIAKAGRLLLVKSMVARAKCALKAIAGKKCDPSGKVSKIERKATRQIVKGCRSADLSQLNRGGCAAKSSSVDELASCIVDSHGSAIADLIIDEFGKAASGMNVLVKGSMVSSGSALRVGPHLHAAGITTAAISLTDLKLYCVTFEDPPAAGTGDVAADGSFSVSIAAAGTPFGCFVIEKSTGNQVATLVLRRSTTSLAGTDTTDTTQITTDDSEIDLGKVTLNLDEGVAIADAASVKGKTSSEVDNPFDPTGTWKFACVEPPPDSGYESCEGPGPGPDPGPGPGGPGPGPIQERITVRQAQQGPGEYGYLHRISGTDADGNKRYGLGLWDSKAAFLNCGGIEGVATTQGGTTTSSGITLDVPDGVFNFTPDSVWQALVDPYTSPQPPPPPGGWPSDMPPPPGTCNSSADTCAGVKNADLDNPTPQNCDALFDPQADPATQKFCWGTFDPDTQTFTPFTNDECVNMCYQDNFFMWDVQKVLNDPANGFCLEDRRPQFDGFGPPKWVGTGNPITRRLFAEMIYSSNTSASMTVVEPTETIVLFSPDVQPGQEPICHVTRTIKINLNMVDPKTIDGEFSQTATLRAGDPDACTDESSGFNFVADMVNNPERMLFRLYRAS